MRLSFIAYIRVDYLHVEEFEEEGVFEENGCGARYEISIKCQVWLT